MINEALRAELIAMREEDLRVRSELDATGELGGHYVPRMEAVHLRNAARLRELVARHGWPAEDIAGEDGAKAAWFITQHAIGEPAFQRETLATLRECAAAGRVPAWHAAYLEDRVNMYEGRPQRFGTQWMDSAEDGRARPYQLAEPDRVDELRVSVGLPPLHSIPELGPPLPEGQRRALEENYAWWNRWAVSKGWREVE